MNRRKLLARLIYKMKMLDKLFLDYIDVLRRAYPRSTVVLYGSRARCSHLPHSDYDILIIFESVVDRIDETIKVRRLKPREIPLDILVIGVDGIHDPIMAKMLQEGCYILHDGLDIKSRLKGCIAGIPPCVKVDR